MSMTGSSRLCCTMAGTHAMILEAHKIRNVIELIGQPQHIVYGMLTLQSYPKRKALAGRIALDKG